MRIGELMNREVTCCRTTDRLNDVSHIMWEGDRGVVPVIDSEERIVGLITDRDVAMAAYTTGRNLRSLAAEDAMSHVVHCCRETDPIETAHRLLREMQVRRLPVIDEDRKLVGLIGLSDLARVAAESGGGAEAAEFAATFVSVSRSRKAAHSGTKAPSPRERGVTPAKPAKSAKPPRPAPTVAAPAREVSAASKRPTAARKTKSAR
jgi:CBS domain-containing protein